jgi:hypothetical protein
MDINVLFSGKHQPGLKDRKPIEPAPPKFDQALEKEAEVEFEKMFPQADTDMDVHAAQLKAR